MSKTKTKVKIVIGSNYGDEGKGLATNFFTMQSKLNNENCLNILFNGGCQRGHTVELRAGIRHVFHHFGSGSYLGADTYFDQNFMVNPIFFIEELDELKKDSINPKVFIHPDCRVITPYDALINQTVENKRQLERHGSCGHGIWETLQRYKLSKEFNLTFAQLIKKSDEELFDYFKKLRDAWVKTRFEYYDISLTDYSALNDTHILLHLDGLITHYISDLRKMAQYCKIATFEELFPNYNYIIFEGAQGLALDENNTDEYPNVTASSTTSEIPLKRIASVESQCDIEICYITRSYFTRHGAGKLENECSREQINSEILDETNLPNSFQKHLRYKQFDLEDFMSRIKQDCFKTPIDSKINRTLFISQYNYANDYFKNITLNQLQYNFENIYISETRFAGDVKLYSVL